MRHTQARSHLITQRKKEPLGYPTHSRVGVQRQTEKIPARGKSTELSEPENKPPRSALDIKHLSMLERLDEGELVRA